MERLQAPGRAEAVNQVPAKRRKSLLPVVLAAILLAGCTAPAGSGVPTQAGGIKVLATETFLGDIARTVAGERVAVATLLPPGIDPHTFQPAPQDAIKIAESQVLIVNGLGYESWLTKTLQPGGNQRLMVVASDGLTPNPDPSGAQTDGDPHMWMNPLNVIQYATNIRDGLTKADPAGAPDYAANAEAYAAQLKALDQWIKSQVAQLPAAKRLLVTNHDALGYFAQAYGFKVVGAVIPGFTNEASPAPRQMADLIKAIKSSSAPAVFLDVGENTSLADQIAAESGARVVTSLYVETLSAADGPAPTYIEMMKHDVSMIVQALK